MSMAFILKELRENKWVMLIAFIMLGAFTPLYPYSYGSLFAYMIGKGITYDKYLWYDWFMKAQPQIAIIAAIVMGSSVIAREKKNATLGILVSKPVSRTRILVYKLITGSAVLAAIMSADTFILAIASPVMGAQGIDNSIMLLGLIGDILLIIPVYLMSSAFSTIFMNSIKAGIVSTGVTLLLYGPVWMGSKFSAVWWLLESSGVLNPVCTAVLIAVGAIFIWLGIICFNNVDI